MTADLPVTGVKAWLEQDWQYAKTRPYTAEDVAEHIALDLPISNDMPFALRNLLAEQFEAGTCATAIGCAEPTLLYAAAQHGMRVGYVSGAAISFTEQSGGDPGADLSDYSYDTVPRKVNAITRFQNSHEILNRQLAKKGLKGSRIMMPLIADADSGFGLHSSCMKVTKMLVEAGVSGFHIDDMLSGSKRFDKSDSVGGVLVPLSEFVRRLIASQMQLDIMKSAAVLISRTDCIHSTHITSTIDARDRPFILGSTCPSHSVPYADLNDTPSRDAWRAEAKMSTLDQAVSAALEQSSVMSYDEWLAKSADLNVSAALALANKINIPVVWDCEIARTYQGWYWYSGTIEASISRALHTAPYVDAVWYCSISWDSAEVRTFGEAIRKVFPNKWMLFNTTQNSRSKGRMIPADELARIPELLGAAGYNINLMPLAGQYIQTSAASAGCQAIMERGLQGLFETVADPTEKANVGRPLPSSWHPHMGILADDIMDAIGKGL